MNTYLSKFKVSFRDSQIYIKSKISKKDSINQQEIQLFESKYIRGLTRPKVTGTRKIEYIAPGNIRLSEHLRSGLSKNDFFIVFAQFVECLKKVEWNGLNYNNIVLDLSLIFFNQNTREVQFIYEPILNPGSLNNFYVFIYELVNQTVLSPEEDGSFLNHLVNTVQSQATLSTEFLEKYIVNVYPQIYKQIKRSKPGESQSLKKTGRTYFEKKYDETGSNFVRNTVDNHSSGSLNSEINRSLNKENNVFNGGANNGFNSREDFDFENTGILFEEDDNDATGILEEYDDEEGTSILDESEGTALLENDAPSYPYLIRLNSYEKIQINKPVFRIGKEKSYVDYFVMNNNAVSRIHADIIARGNQFFVKDNNSTNHTFVNGTMIGRDSNTEIFDGDAIMLANEPFEFHTR